MARSSKISQLNSIFMSALITTKANAPGKAVNSHTTAVDATTMATQPSSAEADLPTPCLPIQHQQIVMLVNPT